jgi:excisionase family DNA binding protein
MNVQRLVGRRGAVSEPDDPGYLTKTEAAKRARVSVSTVHRAMKNGSLRFGIAGTQIRIRPEWVDQWIEGRDEQDAA